MTPRDMGTTAVQKCDGRRLRELFVGAVIHFERHIAEVNALNVFPVPDGDTGTNMSLTLKAAAREASAVTDASLANVARATAQGALLGARGNSGVILSQFFRGIARSLEHSLDAGPIEFAQALGAGSATAYKAVIKPVEGTMLTVSRDAANAAIEAADAGADLVGVASAAVTAARESVARTPDLLPVLREANVVDAGGQGLFVILEGMRATLAGETAEVAPADVVAAHPAHEHRVAPALRAEPQEFGYCTELIIKGTALDPVRIRSAISDLGTSALIVGDDRVVKVHVHTRRPGRVLEFAVAVGTLHDVKIDNMDDQHRETLITPADSQAVGANAPEAAVSSPTHTRTAVVAVASGRGFVSLLRSLGASYIVPGGQTMNPSTEDLLKAVQEANADEVVILPNNSNILLAAQQAHQLASRRVAVIPTRDMAQGVAACLAYRSDLELATNVAAMERAFRGVRTAEITTAVRAARVNGLSIRPGEALGLTDDRVVAVKTHAADVLFDLLRHMDAHEAEILTIYYGDEVDPATARQLADSATASFPNLAAEVVEGGQPLYQFLIALE